MDDRLKTEPTTLEEAVAGSVKLVALLAGRWHAMFPSVPVDDLIQAAGIGTAEAWARFDPARGFRFITYAGWWWRRRMRDEVQSHIGFGMRGLARGKLRYAGVMHASAIDGSRDDHDAPYGGTVAEKNSSLSQHPAPDAAPPFDYDVLFRAAESNLTKIQFLVLALIYRDGMTLEKAGAVMGCSNENVRQHRDRAIRALRALPVVRRMGDA